MVRAGKGSYCGDVSGGAAASGSSSDDVAANGGGDFKKSNLSDVKKSDIVAIALFNLIRAKKCPCVLWVRLAKVVAAAMLAILKRIL